jgi:hypothetical protein
MDFVGIDPNSPDEGCPAVFVDPITGDLFFQGRVVTDPEILKWFADHAPRGDDEVIIWHPTRMRPIISEALAGTYTMDTQGPGIPTFAELLASTQRSAVHLEMRDQYDENDPAYKNFCEGGQGTYDRSAWIKTVSEAVARGVTMRRLRIYSQPATRYIEWEYKLTDENISAGENVRWLPRKRAYDLLLPGADLWMFDNRLVRFHHHAGDGRSLKEYEFVSDPRRVLHVVGAFEMAWERATPHADHRL